jgi:hypothetical protein
LHTLVYIRSHFNFSLSKRKVLQLRGSVSDESG